MRRLKTKRHRIEVFLNVLNPGIISITGLHYSKQDYIGGCVDGEMKGHLHNFRTRFFLLSG